MARSTEGTAVRIVVGCDGSEGSREALRWAVGEAKLRGATLEIVYAWQQTLPMWAGFSAMGATVVPPVSVEDLRTFAQSVLDAAIAPFASDLEGLEVHAHLVEGHPADVIVEVSKGADMLVVGSRGLGGVRGAFLGSVSQHSLHHAQCPVVVVPHATGKHAADQQP